MSEEQMIDVDGRYPDQPEQPELFEAVEQAGPADVAADQSGAGTGAAGGEESIAEPEKPRRGRPPGSGAIRGDVKSSTGEGRPQDNKVVKLLEKNPLGMTLPEMAGGIRQIKRIKTMRPILREAISSGLVMPISQRAGHTVYRLVKHMNNR